jgi:CRP/FNR family transcriptional regulator, cyclic AMP receptor protein
VGVLVVPLDLIRGVTLFAAADDRFLERLAGEFMERTFSAGETIAEEGESGRTFIVIKSGQVTVTVHGQEVGRLGPGDAFGEMALIDKSARTATVRAHTQVHCYQLPVWSFRPLIEVIPRWRGRSSRRLLGASATPRGEPDRPDSRARLQAQKTSAWSLHHAAHHRNDLVPALTSRENDLTVTPSQHSNRRPVVQRSNGGDAVVRALRCCGIELGLAAGPEFGLPSHLRRGGSTTRRRRACSLASTEMNRP